MFEIFAGGESGDASKLVALEYNVTCKRRY